MDRGSWHWFSVRSLIAPVLVALLSVSLHAQEQDRKLYDRITKPNMEQSFNLQNAAGGSSKSFGTKSANSKGFYFQQKANTGTFRSKEYTGTKTAWMGDFQFGTKTARTKDYATKPAATKAAPVKDARESGKGAPTKEYVDQQKEFTRRGRSQDRLDAEGGVPKDGKPVGWDGNMKPMTIDEVRELLNKSK
jgi:hypothetical protein